METENSIELKLQNKNSISVKRSFLMIHKIIKEIFRFIRDVGVAMAEESEIEKERTKLINKGFYLPRIY